MDSKMPLAHQADLADMRFNDLFVYMQEWLGKWHILRRQNKIDLLSQCHRVVRFKRLDHMCDADVTHSERRKLWEELVGWLLCVLYGYRHYQWSSEEFLELCACGNVDYGQALAVRCDSSLSMGHEHCPQGH